MLLSEAGEDLDPKSYALEVPADEYYGNSKVQITVNFQDGPQTVVVPVTWEPNRVYSRGRSLWGATPTYDDQIRPERLTTWAWQNILEVIDLSMNEGQETEGTIENNVDSDPDFSHPGITWKLTPNYEDSFNYFNYERGSE